MNIFTLDTSCMIALVSGWHKRNAAAVAEIEGRVRRGERLAILAPALVETYSVLTRMPAPYRLAPADAWAMIEVNFVEGREIVTLGGASYVAVLRQLAKEHLGGGRTYDAMIAACARQAKATALLTFNRRHFEPPPEGVAVVEPS